MKSASELYEESLKLSIQGKNEEALKICDKLIQIRGNSYDYNLHGACFYNLKKYDEAIKSLNKSVQLDFKNSYAYCNLGHVNYDNGNKEEALKYYRKSLEYNCNFAHGFDGVAKVLFAQGKTQESIEYSNKALYLDDKTPSFFCTRAKAYKQLGQDDLALKDIKTASQLIENKSYGDLTSGLLDYVRETIKELLILEDSTNNTEKVIANLEKKNLEAEKVIAQFKKLKDAKNTITKNIINTLDEKVQKTLTEQELTIKQKVLDTLNKDPTQLFVVLEQYPQASSYPEIMPFIVKFNVNLQQRVLNLEAQVEKHEEALQYGGVYDKAYIKKSFQELEEQSPKLYEYNKVFYWTMLNYFSAYKALSTDLMKGNVDKTATQKENFIVSGIKFTTKLAGNLPIFNGIVDTIDSIVDGIYGAVKDKRFEDRVNAINMIIMLNKDPKAQLDDELNLCIAKAAVEIAKAKKDEILNPQPLSPSKFAKSMKFLEEQVEKLKAKALGAKIDMYESEAATTALKDVSLVLAYFYKNHEIVIRNTGPLDTVIKNIVVSGKAESVLGTERNFETVTTQQINSPEQVSLSIQKERNNVKSGKNSEKNNCCNIF